MSVESYLSLGATTRNTTTSPTLATGAKTRQAPGSTAAETTAPSAPEDRVSLSHIVAEVAANSSSLVNFGAWNSVQPVNGASPSTTDPAISASSASTSNLGKTELKLGSRGPEVKKLQQSLNKKTGANLKIDGIFGPKTQQALEKAKKLENGGPAGPPTGPGVGDTSSGTTPQGQTGGASAGGDTGSGTTTQGQTGGGPGGNTPSESTPQNNPAETSGQQQASSSGTLQKSAKGRVNQNDLRAYLEQRIASSGLNGFKPQDGASYGVDGSAKSWANFMTKLVGKESNFNSNDVSEPDAFRGGSRGLFQLSFDDAKNYGLNGGKPFSAEQLADPKANADAAVTIMERLVKKNGTIRGGAGKYWGPIKRGWKGQ